MRQLHRKWIPIMLVSIVGVLVVIWRAQCAKCHPNILSTRMDVVVPPFTDPFDEPKHDVILSAYMNSGSRFTGRLLGYLPDAFYFYEPLWKFSIWDYWKPPDVQCSTIAGECKSIHLHQLNAFQPDQNLPEVTQSIVQNITGSFAPIELLVNVVSRVFSCDLVSLRDAIQDRVQDHPNYAGPSWEEYRSCIISFNSKSSCLRKLETTCRERSHRVTKSLRLTLGALRPLLENNPRLKIVHLVRDPRAIVHSRRYSRFYPTGQEERDKLSMEKNLCDKMLQDVVDGIELMKEYPSRIVFLYYEDLLENLHTRLKQLYTFLEMKYDRKLVDKLAEVRTNLPPPQKGIDFFKDRERNNTRWWRKYMDWSDVIGVDSVCSRVYSKLGYIKFYSETHLRDFTYSSYSIPDMLTLPD